MHPTPLHRPDHRDRPGHRACPTRSVLGLLAVGALLCAALPSGTAAAEETGPASAVRVNQVGYLPQGPKGATVVSDAEEPQRWLLRDERGRAASWGRTEPRGFDPTAGVAVHSIDFSDFAGSDRGYTLTVGEEVSRPFDIAHDVYAGLRHDPLTFFHTNRSGIAIDDALVPGYGRPAGHLGVAPNQGDTAVPCQALDDDSQLLLAEPWTCEGTHDVRGGWYDAGDHGKYVVNAGVSVSQLLMAYQRSDATVYADGTLAIPEAGNGMPDLLDEVRWELEWMLRMQLPSDHELGGMVFHKVADVDWTGIPMLPSDDPQPRALFRPSTAATLNLAGAGAQAARLYADVDPAFAERLLAASRTAYRAAQDHPTLYAPAPDYVLDPDPGSGPYDDDDVSDEFYWAAAELYLATGEDAFLADLQASPHHEAELSGISWRDMAALGQLDLATTPSALPDRERVRASVVEAADQLLTDQASQPFGQAYAPADGQYVWGSSSAILNGLQVVGTAYDLTGEQRYADAVVASADYLFGRNALDISYVTGYGQHYARNQHSRWYANQADPSLPHPPPGTVAGGPNSTAVASGDPVAVERLQGCVAQTCYVDDIGSWSTNEITINWNAPMVWVGGFLAEQGERSAGR